MFLLGLRRVRPTLGRAPRGEVRIFSYDPAKKGSGIVRAFLNVLGFPDDGTLGVGNADVLNFGNFDHSSSAGALQRLRIRWGFRHSNRDLQTLFSSSDFSTDARI